VPRRFAPRSVEPRGFASAKLACTGLACTSLAAAIGLVALFVPAAAVAQTNLDQGKSASQIFASDCAECHKGARGLAKGRNGVALTDFLREHYTTSREQAAALAAYVLGGRDIDAGGPGSFTPGQKPGTDRGRASAEEPKPGKPPVRQVARPEVGIPPDGKPQDEASPAERPQALGSRTRRREPKTPQPALAPVGVAHGPAPATETPTPGVTPSQETNKETNSPAAASTSETAAPADAASGENTPVPRDNIPD